MEACSKIRTSFIATCRCRKMLLKEESGASSLTRIKLFLFLQVCIMEEEAQSYSQNCLTHLVLLQFTITVSCINSEKKLSTFCLCFKRFPTCGPWIKDYLDQKRTLLLHLPDTLTNHGVFIRQESVYNRQQQAALQMLTTEKKVISLSEALSY